jgi:hypothetical protein
MLHQWICRGSAAPNLESLGLGAKLVKTLSVVLLACCLLAPRPAAAAYASTLQTLYDAISGNAAAKSQLAADLGSPVWTNPGYCGTPAPTPIDWFLTNITSALGGTSSALATVQGAINLNVANTKTLQNALGGSFFYNLSYYNCYDGFDYYTGYYLAQYTNGYDQLVNTIIAGQAANSYITIIDALQGDAGAIKTLDTVLYHAIPGYGAVDHTAFLNALTDFVGTTTGTAAADNFSTGTCPATTTSFTLSQTPVSLDSTRVTMNASDSFAGDGTNNAYLATFAPSSTAVIQKNGTTLTTPADYTVSGNTITFTTIPSGTDIITLSDNITEYNTYSGTGGTTYTVGFPLGPAKPTVTVNGVVQPQANYTISGNTVTFTGAPGTVPATGTNVMISNYSVSGTTLTFNNSPGCGYTMQAAYTSGLGGGGTTAATIALFQAGLGGDTDSNNQINIIISNILSSNAASSPPLFIANGLDFVTSVPANPGGIIDTDGDGIPDSIDPDIDGDGVPNTYDVCPQDATNSPGCGGTTQNTDTDGDGIPDIVDSTPNGDGSVAVDGSGNVTATGPGGTPITGSGSSSPPTNKCGSKDAPLTGDFGVDPCDLTEDNLNLTGNSNYWAEGGKQFADHLDKWWTNQFEPALKNMTAQLNASRIDQSRQMGSTMDSHNLTKSATAIQQFELQDKANLEPNERICVAGSANAPLANEDYTGTALTGGLVFDHQTRTGGDSATATPKPANATVDMKNQFDIYCKYFDSTKVNAGTSPCPTPTDGPLPNGDIEVENFLLKDTIDLKKPEEYAAAHAFLTNVVQPRMLNQITPDMLTTSQGKQYVLERQHIDALRNLAASVVASIISRRASIPLPKEAGGTAPLPPASTPPPPPEPAPTSPGSAGSYDDFIAALERMESGGSAACRKGKYGTGPGAQCQNGIGYSGLLQWGGDALNDLNCYAGTGNSWTGGWKGVCAAAGIHSISDFLANPGNIQETLVKPWLKLMHDRLDHYHLADGGTIWSAACTTRCGHWITPSGLIAAYHLLGDHVREWLNDCSNPTHDANGTTPGNYIDRFAGYDTPFAGPTCGPAPGQVGSQSGSGTGTPPPPPKPVGETIYDIRHRAGIPDSEIAKDPSYNEIMLALTKERFFDPDYYARMNGNLNAIKQEQSSVKAYISIQLQDIYMLEEQINSLLAAKAAMTYDKAKSNHQEDAPVH